jgi:hypothetical protein
MYALLSKTGNSCNSATTLSNLSGLPPGWRRSLASAAEAVGCMNSGLIFACPETRADLVGSAGVGPIGACRDVQCRPVPALQGFARRSGLGNWSASWGGGAAKRGGSPGL